MVRSFATEESAAGASTELASVDTGAASRYEARGEASPAARSQQSSLREVSDWREPSEPWVGSKQSSQQLSAASLSEEVDDGSLVEASEVGASVDPRGAKGRPSWRATHLDRI